MIRSKGGTMKQTFWDPRWDERFSEKGFFYGTEPNDFLREHYKLFKDRGSILCLGEGEGRNAVFLAQCGFDVTAVDGSSKGFLKLNQLAQEKKVKVNCVLSDLAEFQIGREKWNGIVSIWCHLPKELWKELYQKIQVGLKPGGLFLLEHYTPRQLQFKTGGPPTEDLLTTLTDLKSELSSLNVLMGQEIDRDIKEGRGHVGKSAVVQFIGRK
jgi:SAM-dependent methyltransferase